MAIFRAETKHITRSKNHNVVSASAYRAGQKLKDTNKYNPDAQTYDYSKKKGVVATGIIMPQHLKDADFKIERQDLWSAVEEHETTTRSVKGSRLKQKARLAREWLIALPAELTKEENEELTKEFTKYLVDELNVIADYAIHEPTKKNYKNKKRTIKQKNNETGEVEEVEKNVSAKEPDNRNVHAHILFSTRKVDIDNDGKIKFGEKADSERSEKWRKENGLKKGGDYIKEVREKWASLVNKRLEQKNIIPITHKSYKELGLDIIPQAKKGKNAQTIELYGLDEHPRIKGFNNEIVFRNRQYIKSTADSYIADAKRELEKSEQEIKRANTPRPSPFGNANNNGHRGSRRTKDTDKDIAEFNAETERFNQTTERTDRDIERRKSEIISISDTARRLAERDAMMFINREHDTRYTDEQRKQLQAFAEREQLQSNDVKSTVEFFNNANNIKQHQSIIATIRRPHEQPTAEPTATATATPTTTTQATPQPAPSNRPKPRRP